MTRLTLTTALAALLSAAIPVSAQTRVPWSGGAEFSVFSGGASATGGTDPLAGASLGWELSRYFTLEGTGLWIDSRQMNVYAAFASGRVTLPMRRKLAPFVSAGAGIHSASVDPNGPGIPAFYARRMTMPTGLTLGADQRFDDPMVAFGGGFDMFINRHVAFRPDCQVLLVFDGANTRPVTTLAIHLAYHFEEHSTRP
jgi:hypothetical protein